MFNSHLFRDNERANSFNIDLCSFSQLYRLYGYLNSQSALIRSTNGWGNISLVFSCCLSGQRTPEERARGSSSFIERKREEILK